MKFSIIYKSKLELERTFRIDAEFYKPEVLEVLTLLRKKQPLPLTNYVKVVSDGNHAKMTEFFQDYPGIPYYGAKDISTDFFLENARPVYIPEEKYQESQIGRCHFPPEMCYLPWREPLEVCRW